MVEPDPSHGPRTVVSPAKTLFGVGVQGRPPDHGRRAGVEQRVLGAPAPLPALRDRRLRDLRVPFDHAGPVGSGGLCSCVRRDRCPNRPRGRAFVRWRASPGRARVAKPGNSVALRTLSRRGPPVQIRSRAYRLELRESRVCTSDLNRGAGGERATRANGSDRGSNPVPCILPRAIREWQHHAGDRNPRDIARVAKRAGNVRPE